jgi:outer membrane protein assembly factor BamA
MLLSVGFFACGVKKAIPQNKHLLKKNNLVVQGNSKNLGDLTAQILHRNNKRVLFNKLPIFLWLYALGTDEKNPELSDSVAWRRKLRNEMGEPPVLFDEQLAKISAENIKNYLINNGYFDADVKYSVKFSNRKAKVTYTAIPGKPYRINSLYKQPVDSAHKRYLDSFVSSSDKFRLWWPCNLNYLNEAKDQLSSKFRDVGFYTISKDFIRYEIDTLNDKKEAAIFVILDNLPGNEKHKKYHFGGIKININTSEEFLGNKYPSIVFQKGIRMNMNHYPLDPDILNKLILLDSGDVFNQTQLTKTYRALIDLGLFVFVDFKQDLDYKNSLILLTINLKTSPRMGYTIEPQLLYSPQGSSGLNLQTSSQRSFGLAGILSFINKNTNGNGELFKLSSITSFEAIYKRDNFGNFFTGLQQGLVATLTVPNFKFFDKLDAERKYEKKNTVFSLSYQFESNPNFTRSSLPASVSLQFIKPNFSWYYTPVEISFNRNIIDPVFFPQLPLLDQDFVRRVFTDQIITASKLGFVYSNNQNKPGESSIFARMGFETSGNAHRWYRQLTEKNFVSDSSYKLFGVNYFQYAKIEAEFRFKQNIDVLNSVAFRVNAGLAIPFGNSSIVPYDKRYFIGGSNSLRAWQPRRLGPGNTPTSSQSLLDKSGEFLLETNIEYRFTIIKKFIESAIFLDAGNIWNLNKLSVINPDNGILSKETFVSEIALNTGIGLRFDLSIFLFRIDWGIPLRDPSKVVNQRWVVSENISNGTFGDFLVNQTAIAIGIGYPF